jgi:hypothetical protein
MFFVVVVIAVIVWWCLPSPRDDTDPIAGRRSGLVIYTDHKTGLQYLSAGFRGGITPRLDNDGNHMKAQDERK